MRKGTDKGVDTSKMSKMRHAVPLTAFQERLFDIVCKSFKNDFKVEDIPTLVLQEPVSEEEVIHEKIRCSEYSAKTTPVWIDSIIHFFESFIGIIEENFMFLIGLFMFAIIMTLQILSTWGLSDEDIFLKNGLSVLKNILFIMTILFFLYRFVKKIRTLWNELKKWIEEPIDEKEVHRNVK